MHLKMLFVKWRPFCLCLNEWSPCSGDKGFQVPVLLQYGRSICRVDRCFLNQFQHVKRNWNIPCLLMLCFAWYLYYFSLKNLSHEKKHFMFSILIIFSKTFLIWYFNVLLQEIHITKRWYMILTSITILISYILITNFYLFYTSSYAFLSILKVLCGLCLSGCKLYTHVCSSFSNEFESWSQYQ